MRFYAPDVHKWRMGAYLFCCELSEGPRQSFLHYFAFMGSRGIHGVAFERDSTMKK
jgi:hypothetical protein